MYLRVLRVMRSLGAPLSRRSDLQRLRYLRAFCVLGSLRRVCHRKDGTRLVQILLHDYMGVEQNQGQLGALWRGIPSWYREQGIETLIAVAIDTLEEQVYEYSAAHTVSDNKEHTCFCLRSFIRDV